MKDFIYRDMIVNYLVDSLGYGVDDTEGFTKGELWEWLTDEQMDECLQFNDIAV